jgi:hypothetical protein
MAVIERSVGHSRRDFARGLCAAMGLACVRRLLADKSSIVLRVLDHVATALDAGNETDALAWFDKQMAGYGLLEDYFAALTSQTSAHSDIDLLEETDSETEVKAVLRWILDLRDKVTNEAIDRRIVEVHVRLTRAKDKPENWTIVAFEPISLFNPAVQ